MLLLKKMKQKRKMKMVKSQFHIQFNKCKTEHILSMSILKKFELPISKIFLDAKLEENLFKNSHNLNQKI